MRRASLTQTQAQQLAGILKPRRQELGYSIRVLAAKAETNKSTVDSLERATNLTPQPAALARIATALGLSVSDLLVTATWLPAGELPTLRPYLRAKYGLSEADADAVDDYLSHLQQRHAPAGTRSGPLEREDEH